VPLPADLHATAAQRLQAAGLRYTGSRRRVVAVLDQADRPLTIPEILGHDATLAQSSAYRNLSELIAAGVVHRIIAGDEFSHYELAEDLTAHHHHLVCTHCGRVQDFVPTEALESALGDALAKVAATTGFGLQHHRLDLIGTCADCTPAPTP
jgi:Fur family transcriptional regulator, ferric uptake regulator